eukprot:9912501-Ditylum_brightwellii.AAC.1
MDRGEGKFWDNDDVLEMRNVRKITRKKLVRVGIEKVAGLKYLDNDNKTMVSISNKTNVLGKGLTVSVSCKFVCVAHDAHEDNPPQTVDYHQALNLYKILYGEQWEEKIRHSMTMKKY